jgi:four helix bundle protein
MNEQDLIERTKKFALRVINVVRALPKTVEARVIADQLTRSGTSVAANYRAACKGRSLAEFISKLGTVEEEADETASWLELLIDGKIIPEKSFSRCCRKHASSLPFFAASRKTASHNASTKSQIENRKLKIKRQRRRRPNEPKPPHPDTQ